MGDWGYLQVRSVRIERDLTGRPRVVVEYSTVLGNTPVDATRIYNINIGRLALPPSYDPVTYAAWSAAREYLVREEMLRRNVADEMIRRSLKRLLEDPLV